MKLGQNFVLMKSQTVWKWVMLGQKLGQFLEKPCILSRGCIFSSTIMKLGQNVCLDVISDVFENGSGQKKN